MGLTAPQEQRLRRAGFVDFFNKNRKHFKELAEIAYGSTASILKPSKMRVRIDDVFGLALTLMELDDVLTKFQQSHTKLSGQFWVKWFTAYVLDELMEELEDEHGTSGSGS